MATTAPYEKPAFQILLNLDHTGTPDQRPAYSNTYRRGGKIHFDFQGQEIVADSEVLNNCSLDMLRGSPLPEDVQEVITWIESLDEGAIVEMHKEFLDKSLSEYKLDPTSESGLAIKDWIFGSERKGIPFSFRTCCELQGADHEVVREMLLAKKL